MAEKPGATEATAVPYEVRETRAADGMDGLGDAVGRVVDFAPPHRRTAEPPRARKSFRARGGSPCSVREGGQPAKQSGWPPEKAKQETWREVVPLRPPRSVTVSCTV